jgi:hypothetical protein
MTEDTVQVGDRVRWRSKRYCPPHLSMDSVGKVVDASVYEDGVLVEVMVQWPEYSRPDIAAPWHLEVLASEEKPGT